MNVYGHDWTLFAETGDRISLEHFSEGMKKLMEHPEYSSKSILRAELVEMKSQVYQRHIIPKRANLDKDMHDECRIEGNYAVMLPRDTSHIPYYYPQAAGVLFECTPDSTKVYFSLLGDSVEKDRIRLERTALALLKQALTFSRGIESGYQKRVVYDILTGREEVQDLYRQLKDKYNNDIASIPTPSARITFRWLLNEWRESTDPAKHVWEDVAIASYLIILWKRIYPNGHPPGGFVDLGCGNGLLVYILRQEGFEGFGLDLRERKSWSLFREKCTDIRLDVTILDPITLLLAKDGNKPLCTAIYPEQSFIIGNHADELTPWVPLLASQIEGSAFLNIPCCPFELSQVFTRQAYTIPEEFISSLPIDQQLLLQKMSHLEASISDPIAKNLMIPFYLSTPNESTQMGRYFAFQKYLAHLSLLAGWVPEREALRMPSTKNFGFVGRIRLEDLSSDPEKMKSTVYSNVQSLVQEAAEHWKPRDENTKEH